MSGRSKSPLAYVPSILLYLICAIVGLQLLAIVFVTLVIKAPTAYWYAMLTLTLFLRWLFLTLVGIGIVHLIKIGINSWDRRLRLVLHRRYVSIVELAHLHQCRYPTSPLYAGVSETVEAAYASRNCNDKEYRLFVYSYASAFTNPDYVQEIQSDVEMALQFKELRQTEAEIEQATDALQAYIDTYNTTLDMTYRYLVKTLGRFQKEDIPVVKAIRYPDACEIEVESHPSITE